jgi:hypothetical protein
MADTLLAVVDSSTLVKRNRGKRCLTFFNAFPNFYHSMLDMDPKNPKGWLIDLEMAVKWSKKDEQRAKETFAQAPDPSLDPDFGDMELDNPDASTSSPPPSLRSQEKWKAERTVEGQLLF